MAACVLCVCASVHQGRWCVQASRQGAEEEVQAASSQECVDGRWEAGWLGSDAEALL